MDFKGQVNRGMAPGKWDQRKTSGAFQGADDGVHVRTAVEFRAEGELAELLTDPAKLQEFIQPGDNVLQVVNRLFQHATEHQPGFIDPLLSVFGVGGSGPAHFGFFAYDND